MVPWQEPWAGDIYSGSWKSIGPARIQIKGSVTHQPYKGKQIFSLCWCRCILWTCVLGGKQITCWRGRGTEVVKALVLVAAPLLLHKLKRVSRGDLKGERKFLLMTLRSRRVNQEKGNIFENWHVKVNNAGSHTFLQLQSMSKAKRRHTWDIPLMLGRWGWGPKHRRGPTHEAVSALFHHLACKQHGEACYRRVFV